MGLKRPRINLERADAGEIIKRAVPSRARLALAIYEHDGATRAYRWLPEYSIIVAVYTKAEVDALWHSIADTIERGAWRDDQHRDRVARMGTPDVAASSVA